MKNSFPIAFDYNMQPYTGTVTPLEEGKDLAHTSSFEVELRPAVKGHIQHIDNDWKSDDINDNKLVHEPGSFIEKWIA